MAGKTKFAIAENSIRNYFQRSEQKIYTHSDLIGIHESKKYNWHLAQASTPNKFLEQLLRQNILHKIELDFEGYLSKKDLYATEEASIFQVSSAILPRGYLSHYTAMFIHGLTTQVPSTVYLTFEHSAPLIKKAKPKLIQGNIDAAFSKPQKIGATQVKYQDARISILNGKYVNRLGVLNKDGINYTNLERTLVDIVVRPAYSGGVSEILEAYRVAKALISVNKLVATIKRMEFIYPYYQAIGFYMEKAGFTDEQLRPLEEFHQEYDFYLAYDMKDMNFSKKWRLYYPAEL